MVTCMTRLSDPKEIRQYIEAHTPPSVRRHALQAALDQARERANLLLILRTLADEQPLEPVNENDPDSVGQSQQERLRQVDGYDRALREVTWSMVKLEELLRKIPDDPAPAQPKLSRAERRRRDREVAEKLGVQA